MDNYEASWQGQTVSVWPQSWRPLNHDIYFKSIWQTNVYWKHFKIFYLIFPKPLSLGKMCVCVHACVFIYPTCITMAQIYPDEGHFLSRRSRIQLTHSLVGYFRGCLLDSSTLPDQQRDDEWEDYYWMAMCQSVSLADRERVYFIL